MSEPVFKFQSKNHMVKVPASVVRDFVIGIASALFVLVIVFIILWTNRGTLIPKLVNEYISETTTSNAEGGKINPTNPPLLSSDSYVVAAVKRANPAVVSIIISKNIPKVESQPVNPFNLFFNNPNDPFSQFFQQIPQNNQAPESGVGTEQEIGGGSGFLISADGLIVTNRHVVEDTTATYTVYTNDGKKYTAKVLARDSVLDVAVIKITPITPAVGTKFPYLTLGDSDALELGQSAIAIGNALGEFKNSVSVGVISGLSRSITAGDGLGASENLDRVIQTDAAINPGNSGGPLLNLSGEVIGVNVAVAEGSQSVGFALPINSIKTVINSVEKNGTIVRPYIGIRYIEITPEIADANHLSVDYGILVARGETPSDLAVIPGSPADKAGILENDIILELDGTKLDQDQNFALLIRDKNIGDVITLKVLSKGVMKTVQVKLEKAPEN